MIFSDSEGPTTAADMRDRVRHFFPYRVTEHEEPGFAALAREQPREGSAAARAARWYLRAAQQGPSPDAIVALWIAIETLSPTRKTSPKWVVAALSETGWDVNSQDLTVGRLAGLRADIVHHGVEDAELIQKGYYHLEAITRVLLRRELGTDSSWPPQTGANWLVVPPAGQIEAAWRTPQTVWHDDGLPEPDARPSVGPTQWHPPLVPPEDGDPPDVEVIGAVEDVDARRARYWTKQACRVMGDSVPAITVTIAADPPGELATNDSRIQLAAALMREPNALREMRLAWLIQAGVAQHLAMRRGLLSDGGLGTLLLELVGSWAQHREFVAGDGPWDDEDLTVREPDTAEPDLFTVGGHVGAAVAGSERARSVLARWGAEAANADLVQLVQHLQAQLAPIDSPQELLDAVVDLYSRAQAGA